LIAALLICGASSAQAQSRGQLYRGLATGLVASSLGGDLNDPVMTLGGTVSVQDEGGWGAEIDFAVGDDNNAQNREADITSLTVGVNYFGIIRGVPVHPYGGLGVGTLGVHGCLLPCSRVTTTWNLGLYFAGGAQYDLNDIVGLRGDVRFMMAPGGHSGTSRPDNWKFWRVAFGLTVGWTIQ
jgi:hypothetical protein